RPLQQLAYASRGDGAEQVGHENRVLTGGPASGQGVALDEPDPIAQPGLAHHFLGGRPHAGESDDRRAQLRMATAEGDAERAAALASSSLVTTSPSSRK